MNRLLDGLPLWIAVVPLGFYFLWLGTAHLRHRPLVVSGVWDGIGLGVSLVGLVMAGPLALVRPATGSSPWIWPMLVLVFALVVALCVLASRPRLVIYNISVEQLRPLVVEVASSLDPTVRWAGESAALPSRGFQLHIDGDGSMRSASIVAVVGRSSQEGWVEFSRRLRRAVGRLKVRSNPWGLCFAAIGFLLLCFALWHALGLSLESLIPRRFLVP